MNDVAFLRGYLGWYDDDGYAKVTVRFPELGWEVDDWAFEVSESFDGPAFVADVRMSSLDCPDVVRRLKALVDEAARNNLVD